MKLVKVTWHDAEDPTTNVWTDEEDAEVFADQTCEIVSYGLVVKQTPGHLTIGADWIARDRNWGRLTKIPMGMIVSVEEIA